jgi:hypothetical protein
MDEVFGGAVGVADGVGSVGEPRGVALACAGVLDAVPLGTAVVVDGPQPAAISRHNATATGRARRPLVRAQK